MQRLLQSVSPFHGRILIYVWAIEQDQQSKRTVPTSTSHTPGSGQDVFVPWVLKPNGSSVDTRAITDDSKVLKRYYHFFAEGELASLVKKAASDLGLGMGSAAACDAEAGVEIIQDGWERSNYYVELRHWKK
jgi:tRNA (uracil-5-)-methyltransferase TRM9